LAGYGSKVRAKELDFLRTLFSEISILALTFDRSYIQRKEAPFWNQHKITNLLNPFSTYFRKKKFFGPYLVIFSFKKLNSAEEQHYFMTFCTLSIF
jgi:hypothetical protein